VINATNKVYCIGSDLTGGALNSGTYFLYNASINITSGTLTCSGCTFILTGSAANKLGQIKINGGTVTMSAPSSTQQPPPYDSNYIGMLFYMDPRFPKQAAQKCGVGNAQVNISGSSTTTLNGGMYFPNASVCVSGNAFSSTESCLSLVAWSIYYDGSANETLTGCSSFDTKTAEVRAIQLVL
jgi:hypothetical protein